MNELLKRTLVAIIGIPIAVIIIINGGLLFFIAITVLAAIGLSEFYGMSHKKGAKPYKIIGFVFLPLILFDVFQSLHTSYQLHQYFRLSYLSLILITIIIAQLSILWSKRGNTIVNLSVTLSGIILIGFSFSSLILIREFGSIALINTTNIDNSNLLFGIEDKFILSILISIWLCDTAAYFAGKSLGKHKLFPSVSPNKTWEGAIAGFITALLSMVLATQINLLIPEFPLLHAVVIGIIIGVLGQIGDLAESKLKRDAGVKDSSSLLPGHGGVLDRLDSILFVFPSVFLYLMFISFVLRIVF